MGYIAMCSVDYGLFLCLQVTGACCARWSAPQLIWPASPGLPPETGEQEFLFIPECTVWYTVRCVRVLSRLMYLHKKKTRIQNILKGRIRFPE
jgi:hypothetical protein